MSQKFDIKTLGHLRYFLGIEVARSPEGIFLSHRKYVLDLLREVGMTTCKPANSPVDVNVKLKKGEGGKPVNQTSYQRLIGKLIYLNHTRPEIAFAVNTLSQFMSAPYEDHLKAAYRVLAYLKGTIGQGLMYSRSGGSENKIYTDADWASSVIDRRSVSAYCVYLGGSLVSWRSKKQKDIALSSAKAELGALVKGIQEAMWIRGVLGELKLFSQNEIKVYCDNLSEIAMAKNPIQHEKTKYSAIKHGWIMERIEKKIIQLVFVPLEDQAADILTKGLPGPRFKKLTDKLGMANIHTHLAGGGGGVRELILLLLESNKATSISGP